MQKRKLNLVSIGLSILGLIGLITSGWLLTVSNVAEASSFCKSSVTCPDGRELVCKGSSCSANQSDSDPNCTADGKAKRCSDPVENINTNKDKEKKKDKKKDGNSNSDSNVNSANTSANNGNTQ
jgi:hypothetical protein